MRHTNSRRHTAKPRKHTSRGNAERNRRVSAAVGCWCAHHELLQRGGKICIHAVRVGLLDSLAEALLEGLHGLAQERERDAALRIAVRHAQVFQPLFADEVEHVPEEIQ